LAALQTAAALGTALWWMTPFTPLQALLLSLAVALMGFAGGLTMSAIKRDRGVKDFGSTIEGHGGILDRMTLSVFQRHSSFISRDGSWDLKQYAQELAVRH